MPGFNRRTPNITHTMNQIPRRILPGKLRPTLAVALLALAGGGTALAQQTAPAPAAADDEVVKLSPFTVTTEQDVGYRASNSIAGTRTNTPIKDIPVNIQVFTKDLADDLLIKNQVGFEAYNAALVDGGDDWFSDNTIQQPYNNFLVRGFQENWGLRDGIREYDPIDTQAFSRVEFVKGPVAALYGLSYPGGVFNNITKTVDFGHNFGNLRLTGGLEGDYRASMDVNVAGNAMGSQKFGVRLNGVYEETKDNREHSDGFVKFENAIVAWQPTPTTNIEIMAERGYRAKPNGLQYFTTSAPGEPDNHSSVPLQVLHPEISWDWNWSNGHDFRSLETHVYRARITQQIGEQFSVQGYYQYSSRLNIDGNGWDANGSGGADSWESAGSGWDQANNRIISTYHYRDWGNNMHSYGATGVYKFDVAGVKNTFAFGASVWREDELSRSAAPIDPLASAIYAPVSMGIDTTQVPPFPPNDVVWETGPFRADGVTANADGFHHENNSNDYYFADWQASWFGDRLKTNIGVNKTNIKLITWNNGASGTPDNLITASKWSPLYGATFDVTKELTLFLVHSTSLFPDSGKDSFGNQFSPKVGSSWEGGVKVELLNGKISGTVSYYDIEQTGGSQSNPTKENANTQRYDSLTPEQRAIEFPAGRPLGDLVPGGKQEAKGFDIDLAFQPIRQWQTVISYTHVDHKFVTAVDPSTPVGTTYPYAIRDRYSLISKYTFTDGPAKNLGLGLGISGGSKQLIDYQSWNGSLVPRYQPARAVVEAFATYRWKLGNYDALIQFNVKNLFEADAYFGWKATGSDTVLAT
jgi:outer membrane receptor protein involved in Fe transport